MLLAVMACVDKMCNTCRSTCTLVGPGICARRQSAQGMTFTAISRVRHPEHIKFDPMPDLPRLTSLISIKSALRSRKEHEEFLRKRSGSTTPRVRLRLRFYNALSYPTQLCTLPRRSQASVDTSCNPRQGESATRRIYSRVGA